MKKKKKENYPFCDCSNFSLPSAARTALEYPLTLAYIHSIKCVLMNFHACI